MDQMRGVYLLHHSTRWRQYEFALEEDTLDGRVYVDAAFHLDWPAGHAEAPGAVRTVRRIVLALGLDSARATFEDLEQCNVWLHCVTCKVEDPHSIIWARSWRNAMSLLDS